MRAVFINRKGDQFMRAIRAADEILYLRVPLAKGLVSNHPHRYRKDTAPPQTDKITGELVYTYHEEMEPFDGSD